MGGTWTDQNKILPGAYINFLTNAPLAITPGERGIVVLLQEMSVGDQDDMYSIKVTDASEWPANASAADKFLAGEALKGAQTVIVYNLGATPHEAEDITAALAALKTVTFNVLCYPYDTAAIHAAIKAWIEDMRDDEGVKIQAVLPDYEADSEAIINVTQAVKLADGTTLTNAQAAAWVAGVTAGANVNQSNTGRKYAGAIDVVPRMTKTEMEAAVTAGEFIFKVDTAQNVTAVYDINSLTTITAEKSKKFTKNRFIRTNDAIATDLNQIFESNFKGVVNNDVDGRSLQRATYIDYFNALQRIGAIQNFTPEDVTVEPGTDADATVVNCYIQQIDSTEKMYMNINLL